MMLIIIISSFTYKNYESIKGRAYELTHQYKGPLDYEIPYILERYNNPENLVVATNYEECSYMYYLNSKVTMGFVLNNLEEDIMVKPDIIVYRNDWGWVYEKDVFDPLFEMGRYDRVNFLNYDYPYNNIPELNVKDGSHLFKTRLAVEGEEKAHLFELKR